jgi:hypothetical protein
VTYRRSLLIGAAALSLVLATLITLRSTELHQHPDSRGPGDGSTRTSHVREVVHSDGRRVGPSTLRPPTFTAAVAPDAGGRIRRVPRAIQKQVEDRLVGSEAVRSALTACSALDGGPAESETVEVEVEVSSAQGRGTVESTRVVNAPSSAGPGTIRCVLHALSLAPVFPWATWRSESLERC